MFLWRAYNDILPTYQNLTKRKLSETNLCPVCGLEVETARHVLWQCPTVQDVYCKVLVKIQKISISNSPFADSWKQFTTKLNCRKLSDAAHIFKRIWFRRNNLIHQKIFTHLNNILCKAKEELYVFIDVNSKVRQPSQATHIDQIFTKWMKPPTDMIKVNWDANYLQQEELTRVGVNA